MRPNASARGLKSKNKQIKKEDDSSGSEDDENLPAQEKAASGGDKKGFNWTAVILLLMFLIPVVLAGLIQVMDYLYPDSAAERRIRERVVKCYEAANPKKMSEIDKFIKKYKGKEYALFAQLRSKYEKYPECQ